MARTISSSYTTTQNLSTAADNPTTVTGTGTISVNSTAAFTGALVGNGGYAWTIGNFGTLESLGSQGIGINLLDGGFIANGVAAVRTALIEGSGAGIQISGSTGASGTVTNYGTIAGISHSSDAQAINFNTVGTVDNSGTLFAGATGGNAIGIVFTSGGVVDNTGLIDAAYGVNDIGVLSANGSAIVSNSGTIDATGTTTGVGVNIASGSVGNTGLISATSTGVNIHTGPGTVGNYGTITATGPLGVGVIVNGSAIITNGSGRSRAAVLSGYRAGISTNNGAVATITNFGTIAQIGSSGYSAIFLSGGGTVANSGTISAVGTNATAIQFGTAGGTVVNGISASSLGLITAYHVGIGFFPPSTVSNLGTLSVLNYGTIESTQPGTAAGTGFLGAAVQGSASATIAVDNFGTIVQRSTSGGWGVILSKGTVINERNATIDGMGGNAIAVSSLTGAGVTIVNLGTITQSTTASGANVYFGRGGGTVTNGASGVSSALIVGSRSAVAFGTTGGAGIVVNFGTIQSTGATFGAGVYFGQGGTLTNQAGGLITALRSAVVVERSAGTVVNFGTISHTGTGTTGDAVYFAAGGTVTNYGLLSGARPGTPASGGTGGYPGVVEIRNQVGTAVNFGTITSPNNSNGVNIDGGGLLVNGSTSATSALISVPHTAVYIGGTSGIPTPGAVGSVFNYGTIEGVGTDGFAIILVSGGTVLNHGLVLSNGRTGVALTNTAGTIDNFGTILSYAPVSGTRGSGAYLGNGGVITNEAGGVIRAVRGAVSLAFFGTTSAAATVSNAGMVTGAVGVNIGAGDTGANTIINTGTIIGTSGIAIELGSGNDLVVIGTNSSLVGAIGNVHPGVNFDLPFLSFSGTGTVTLASGNNLQVIENSSTFTVSLDPSQNLAADFFQLANDGSSGTEVQTVHSGIYAGTYTSGIVLSNPAAQNPATVTSTGYVTNSTATHNGDAVYGTGATAWNFTNLGTIHATQANSDGVRLPAGSTLTNAGTITGAGGTAVAIGANSFVTIVPNAVFSGAVTAAGSADTLTLAAAGVAGTIAGIGSQYTGFDSINVDNGASWQLGGASTIGSGSTVALGTAATLGVTGTVDLGGTVKIGSNALLQLGNGSSVGGNGEILFTANSGELRIDGSTLPSGAIAGFAAGDSIDLTGISADGISYDGSVLTLTQKTAIVARLNVSTIYGAGAAFSEQRDATGGTLVTVTAPIDPSYTLITNFTKTNDIQTGLIKEFPSGVVTGNQGLTVPFGVVTDSSGNNYSEIASTLTINVSLAGVARVYTLINAYAPPAGLLGATVEFIGTGGANQTFNLVNGTGMRDFFQGPYANSINGTTTKNMFTVTGVTDAGGSGDVNTGSNGTYNIDEQVFTLGPSFVGQTLQQIVIRNAQGGGETPILLGLTAQAAITGQVVSSGATLIVSSGEVYDATTVLSGGTLIVLSGGLAGHTSNSGNEILSGGIEVGGVVTSGGSFTVSSGGVASAGVVSGSMTVLAGGSAVGEIVNGGHMVLSGSASSTILNTGASLVVTSAGVDRGAILSGGSETVLTGGADIATTVSNGGVQTVSGSAQGALVQSGGLQIVASGGVASGTVLGQAASRYSAVGDFSITAGNPNNVWSYTSGGTPLNTAVDGTATATLPGVDYWWDGLAVPNSAIVGQNVTARTQTFTTVVVPVDHLVMDPESVGNVSVVFTAPAAGAYTVTGDFLGIDTSEHSHQVEIRLNGSVIFSGTIATFGQSDPFALNLALATDDALAFVVDTGPGGDFQDLGTGLAVTIATGLAGTAGGAQDVSGTASGTVIGAGSTETVEAGGTTIDTTIAGGTLDLVAGGTAQGTVTFAGSGLLVVGAATMPSTPIAGVAAGDGIDLRALTWAPGASAALSGTTLTVTGAGGVTDQLTLTGVASRTTFVTSDDGFGGTLVEATSLPGNIFFGTYTNGLVLSNPAVQQPATLTSSALVTIGGSGYNRAVYGENVTGWTVTNYGAVLGQGVDSTGIGLAAGGSVMNGAPGVGGALVTGTQNGVAIEGAAGSVVNFGTIASTSQDTGVGVHLARGGRLVNGAPGHTGALIEAFRVAAYVGGNNGVAYAGAAATVINYGTMTGSMYDVVALVGGGTVANYGSIVGQGTASGGVYLSPGGFLLNQGVIVGPDRGVYITGGLGTVINQGSIASTNDNAAAVGLAAGGSVLNDAAITAYRVGVFGGTAGSPTSVINLGTIAATATGTQGGPASFGVLLLGSGVVANTGMISAVQPGNGPSTGGVGVALVAGGVVTNGVSGGASGVITGANYGVLVNGGAAFISNYGTIAGATGVSVAGAAGGSTIVNAGTIVGSGGLAVVFGPGEDVLVETAGSVLQGAIGDLQAGDVIDLRFLPFAAGGSAMLGANNLLSVVAGGATAGVQLDPAQNFAGVGFQLSDDGQGGTEIKEMAFGVVGPGQTLVVSAGVTLTGVTVLSGGTLDVLSGGAVITTAVQGGGTEIVEFGGLDVSATLAGLEEVFGVASGTVLLGGASQVVEAGGVTQAVVLDAAAVQTVSGLASGTVVSAGDRQVVASGGVASGTVVSSGGQEIVQAGGTTAVPVISGGGLVDVQAGGVAGGVITFSSPGSGGGGELALDSNVMPAGPLVGYDRGDLIDLRGLPAAGGTVSFDPASGLLTVSGGGVVDTLVLQGGVTPGTVFRLGDDGQGGALVEAAPPAPGGLGLQASSDSGALGDGISNVPAPLLLGSGEANDTVTVFDGTVPVGSATVEVNGSWAAQLATLAEGQHTLTARQTDPAGNVSGPSSGFALRLDLTPPVAAVTAPLTVLWSSGAVPFGIGAPSDASDLTSTLSVLVTGVPGNGAVTLADGVTPVTPFETLSVAQLTGLEFTPGGSDKIGTTGTLGYTVFDPAGNTGSGSAAASVAAAGAASLFSFVFSYADGRDYYTGTVADNGIFGYQVGQTRPTASGQYMIFNAQTLTTEAPGTVSVQSYVHGGAGQASTVPVATAAGQPDGSAGLGSEADAVLGTDGQAHPFSATSEATFGAIALYGFVYTYANGAAFYSGTVADDGTLTAGSKTVSDSSGRVLGTYTVFADGVTTRSAGSVVVDRYNVGDTSFLPIHPTAASVDGTRGLGSELGSIVVNGTAVSFGAAQEPGLQANIVPVAVVPPPAQADIFTAEITEIYGEVLGRGPQTGELASGTSQLSQGTDLAVIRQGLAQSGEAQGDLNQLYQQILDRPGDAAGLANYTAQLIDGASLATVQLLIAQSPEAQADINQIYLDVLGTGADGFGLTASMGALANGSDITALRSAVAHSPAADDSLSQLFLNSVGRTPDAAELAGMEDQLGSPGSGATRQGLQSALAATGSAGGFTMVTAGPGSAVLTAPPNTPTEFVFGNIGFGADTITGFDPSRDALVISSALAPDLATLQADTSPTAAGTLITLSPSQSITLPGINPNALNPNDFRIV